MVIPSDDFRFNYSFTEIAMLDSGKRTVLRDERMFTEINLYFWLTNGYLGVCEIKYGGSNCNICGSFTIHIYTSFCWIHKPRSKSWDQLEIKTNSEQTPAKLSQHPNVSIFNRLLPLTGWPTLQFTSLHATCPPRPERPDRS